MTMVSTGPISLGGTATTSGLNQSVNVELGRSGTASINMNESAVRTLFGVASGAISMSNGYGKSNQFSFSVAANTSNFNLRSAAITAGWNQTSRLVCTINSGVTIFSTSTGTPACTVNGSFPGGVELINNGVILGRGGGGGIGSGGGPGGAGGAGGIGLLVQSAISINNANRISGGGGGGGGAGAQYAGSCVTGPKTRFDDYGKGGGGGGGIGNGTGGNGGGSSCNGQGNPGGNGTLTSAGGGGFGFGGSSGGSGGSYGSSGANGEQAPQVTPAGAGGAGGAAVSGNSNITWIAFGTRNGSIIA